MLRSLPIALLVASAHGLSSLRFTDKGSGTSTAIRYDGSWLDVPGYCPLSKCTSLHTATTAVETRFEAELAEMKQTFDDELAKMRADHAADSAKHAACCAGGDAAQSATLFVASGAHSWALENPGARLFTHQAVLITANNYNNTFTAKTNPFYSKANTTTQQTKSKARVPGLALKRKEYK
jgi:hypothetical protein